MNRQTLFYIICLIIIFGFPRLGGGGDSEKNAAVLATYQHSLRQAHSQLHDSEYWLGYGNLTGLQLSYQDYLDGHTVLEYPLRHYTQEAPWAETQEHLLLPDEVSRRVRAFWGLAPVDAGGKAYPLNISSDLYGSFNVWRPASPIRAVPIELPPYLEHYYNSYRNAQYEEERQRYELDPENNVPPTEPGPQEKDGNFTYTSGDFTVRIYTLLLTYTEINIPRLGLELDHGASLVYANIELRNTARTDTNSFAMLAVYYQDTGALLGVSRSAKFRGTHALPHFAMSLPAFDRAKTLVDRFLLVPEMGSGLSVDDLTRAVEKAETLCEIVAYLQLKKTDYTHEQLVAIDDELASRRGAPLPKELPRIEVADALLYSPDCGRVFQKAPEPMLGIRREVKLAKMRMVLVGMVALTLVEIYLFMLQARECRTPSQLLGVSTLSVALLSGYDLILAMISILVIWITDLYLICACTTVLNVLLFYVFQLRYLSVIRATQANERDVSWWQVMRGSRREDLEAQVSELVPAASPQGTPPVPETPPPATQTQTTPPGDAGASNTMSYFIVSFILSFAFALLVLSSLSWSLQALKVVEFIFFLGINSYWVPQFFRNTLKNRSQSVPWRFVWGTSLVRFLPVAYLCLVTSNPFLHPRNTTLVALVGGWLGLQILLLYAQKRFGPRFWLKSKWLPEEYNYHPVLTVKDLAGYSQELAASLHGDGPVQTCEADCAVCMSSCSFPVVAEGSEKKSFEAIMRAVMVTPCRHVFHTACLEDWMLYKLQCPVCRSLLPPL